MKSGRGKLKGNRWEREVCRLFSLWISAGTRDDLLWRSALSGGRATIGLKSDIERTAQAGDISAITGLGEILTERFIIECKFYEDLQLLRSITNDSGKLYQFWMELRTHSQRLRKHPLLMARQNNTTPFVMMNVPSLGILGMQHDHIVAAFPRWDCVVVLLDVFLREAKVPTGSVCFKKPARVRL